MILNSFLSCFTAMNFVFNMKATACPTAAATINSTWREGTNKDMAPIFIDDVVGGACCDIVADGRRRRRGTGTLEGVWGWFLCQFLPQAVELFVSRKRKFVS
jgi:hypothetical protein